MQPWCTTCGHPGSTDNPLTLDHKPEAWQRRARGLVIRLRDVEVLCLRHNVELGSSRPGTERATHGARGASRATQTAGEPRSRSTLR